MSINQANSNKEQHEKDQRVLVANVPKSENIYYSVALEKANLMVTDAKYFFIRWTPYHHTFRQQEL